MKQDYFTVILLPLCLYQLYVSIEYNIASDVMICIHNILSKITAAPKEESEYRNQIYMKCYFPNLIST
ncbi:hypothetical protein V1478_013335 [Vespula squamosa]|uniref:Secreted protein n=1 Tax=Vespula squamosa TaxID=30214 RepID=A0ABD2AD56_VESSQ